MSFLVIFLVIWVEKFTAWRRRIQHDGPLLGWLARLEQGILGHSPWLLLAVLLGLPLVVLGLVLGVADALVYGWLLLPIHLLVLLFSLGRGDTMGDLGPWRDAWRREDVQGAYHVAERDLSLEPEEGTALLSQVQGHLLWQAYQGFFAVIFWYLLLGPLLALGYRLVALVEVHSRVESVREAARQLRHALDWLPVRALQVTFALVGNFMAVGRALLHEVLSWDISARQLIARTGRAAADLPEPALGEDGVATLDALWQLLIRAAVVWYALYALWVLLV